MGYAHVPFMCCARLASVSSAAIFSNMEILDRDYFCRFFNPSQSKVTNIFTPILPIISKVYMFSLKNFARFASRVRK